MSEERLWRESSSNHLPDNSLQVDPVNALRFDFVGLFFFFLHSLYECSRYLSPGHYYLHNITLYIFLCIMHNILLKMISNKCLTLQIYEYEIINVWWIYLVIRRVMAPIMILKSSNWP